MRKIIIFGSAISIFLISISFAYSQVMAQKNIAVKSTPINHIASNISNKYMTNSTQLVLTISQFIARQDTSQPTGVSPQNNRDIGRATVFLSLENRQQKNQTVIIKKIEVCNVTDNKLQSFIFQPKQIELKPLENSVLDIHLTNKIGYSGKDKVKAIITYQIGKQVNKIESEPVEVDRH
jgi:hypothetical protein